MKSHLKILLAISVLALLSPVPALAQENNKPKAMTGATAATAAADMTDGEVRKVDLEGGKLTLKHAEIKSPDMPGMTMVFAVKDKAMLDKLKAGDKVKFKAVNDAGKFTVTDIQPVR